MKLFFFQILKKKYFWVKTIFLGLRKFSNLNLIHKGLLLQDWVFRLGSQGCQIMPNPSPEWRLKCCQ